MPARYLFLDFDGVLRPDWARRGHFHPPCLARFEAVMRDFPEVDIVISSDWRWQARFQTLVDRFSADIGARIVGVTLFMPSSDDGMRHREILAFLHQRQTGDAADTHWLAIDDTPSLFPAEEIGQHVLLTDPEHAFDAAFETRLRVALAGWRPPR